MSKYSEYGEEEFDKKHKCRFDGYGDEKYCVDNEGNPLHALRALPRSQVNWPYGHQERFVMKCIGCGKIVEFRIPHDSGYAPEVTE